jgi:hypothetical protein
VKFPFRYELTFTFLVLVLVAMAFPHSMKDRHKHNASQRQEYPLRSRNDLSQGALATFQMVESAVESLESQVESAIRCQVEPVLLVAKLFRAEYCHQEATVELDAAN